jgi:hypothetical protein
VISGLFTDPPFAAARQNGQEQENRHRRDHVGPDRLEARATSQEVRLTAASFLLTLVNSYFSVELPGIEPAALPGLLASELPVRYVSFPFSPPRYLPLRPRVLTASRVLA